MSEPDVPETVPVVLVSDGRRGLTKWERRGIAVMLGLAVLMSGGSLLSQHVQQGSFEHTIAVRHQANVAAQASAAALEQKRLCEIFLPISSLKAPANTPGAVNPSRVFEQNLEAKLSEVAPALACKK